MTDETETLRRRVAELERERDEARDGRERMARQAGSYLAERVAAEREVERLRAEVAAAEERGRRAGLEAAARELYAAECAAASYCDDRRAATMAGPAARRDVDPLTCAACRDYGHVTPCTGCTEGRPPRSLADAIAEGAAVALHTPLGIGRVGIACAEPAAPRPIAVGERVRVVRCCGDSYGGKCCDGIPGAVGTLTEIAPSSAGPDPYHVDPVGWVAAVERVEPATVPATCGACEHHRDEGCERLRVIVDADQPPPEACPLRGGR